VIAIVVCAKSFFFHSLEILLTFTRLRLDPRFLLCHQVVSNVTSFSKFAGTFHDRATLLLNIFQLPGEQIFPPYATSMQLSSP